MSSFKQFNSKDVIISPFKVNKSFTFKGASQFTGSNVGIDRFIAKNSPATNTILSEPVTGQISSIPERLLYDSIKQLYYSNFLLDSSGSIATTASFNNDGTVTNSRRTTNYYNYLSSDLVPRREFPTQSNARIGVISIPSKLFGEYIKPNTFRYEEDTTIMTDDGEGNLFDQDGNQLGNIIYEHGVIIVTVESEDAYDSLYGTAIYGTDLYGVSPGFDAFMTGSKVTCSFESTLTLNEVQYAARISENEFGYSLNPTLISGSNIDSNTYHDFATGSFFQPYITTLGMYNNSYDLIAVAKLVKPLPVSQFTDTTIMVNLDLF
tara:strand:+ start:2490 stop:3452 length:963 start_codon:yes stop_codon:yes gene_type:complete